MKSFAPRSQRDRTFDRLVQQASNNHAALLSRSMCKTSSSKTPAVVQRPVSPRKCVTITTFVGDDDGEADEDAIPSPGSLKEKLYPLAKGSQDNSNIVNEVRSSDPQKKIAGQKPLRVTFRFQKCPSSPPKSTAVTLDSVHSPATTPNDEPANITNSSANKPLQSAPLTLSFKRKSETWEKNSDSTTWTVASSSCSQHLKNPSCEVPNASKKKGQMLSSPPIVQNKKQINDDSPGAFQHGIKRKTLGNYESEPLTSFVSGVEERAFPKRRMLSHPNTTKTRTIDHPNSILNTYPSATAATSSVTSSLLSSQTSNTDKSVAVLNKPRGTNSMSQKILMSKTQSLPTDSGCLDSSNKKKPSLLKKNSSVTANRKAIYNPRQWIRHDFDDHTVDSHSAEKKTSKPSKSSSAFDFDSDEEQSDIRSPTPPPSRSLFSESSPASNPRSNDSAHSSKPTSSAADQKATVRDPIAVAQPACTPVGGGPVRVERETKALYTVVRNVKEAHECQESGETQDLLDDVEYMVDGLKKSESPATRCLSLLRLCKECLVHSFRMALKAHGLLPRIFANVSDAPLEDCESGVTLHTAALLFILSRDKLAAGDLDKAGLQLLLRLLRCDAAGLNVQQARDLDRTRTRLRPVIEQMTKANSKNTVSSYLRGLHNTRFTAKDLAAESLLNLSVRKASDWFKNELRIEGGLDHFCQATIIAMEYFNNELESQELTEFMLERLRRIEQYMRLLENMTYMNGANQEYLVQFGERQFLDSIAACLRLCVNNMRRDLKQDSPTMKVLVACLLAIWRVLLNISHDNEKCSDRLGAHPLLVALSLHCILRLPRRLPPHRRFDLLVLSLGFLVNLVEHCDENRSRLAYTHVRLPWRKPKKPRARRGLIMNPAAVLSDSSSESDDDDSSSSSDEEDSRPKTALDALVKLFLERYDASERLELEQKPDDAQGETEPSDQTQDKDNEESEGMKWRLIEDKQLERQRRGRHRPLQLLESKRSDSDGEGGDDDSDSDSGADVEFMPSTQEESAALESALSRAGEHMEASMTASYAALLLGCVMRGSRRRVDRVQSRLPDGRFRPLALSLAKFLGFMSLTSAVGQSGGKSMLEVVHFLHELDGDDPEDTLPLEAKTDTSKT